MSFLHLSLLAGLAAVAVPIMLHFFGQKQPQLIDFPALRFVRETSREQSSSWRLRHVLLLLLRVLLLAALAIALARPRVHSAVLGSVLGISALGLLATLASLIAVVGLVSRRPISVWGTAAGVAIGLWLLVGAWGVRTLATGPAVPSSDQSAPVAAALIVDNGPTMDYRAAGQSRLEEAQAMGEWILDQLPADSRVGVVAGAPIGSLGLDPSSAQTQLGLIIPRGQHVDLLTRIRTALDLVVANELERKEVYVLTDLMSSSWTAAQADLPDLLKEYSEEVLLQVIDLGKVTVTNWHLGDAEPDFKTVPVGGNVTIDVTVRRPADSKDETATVELLRQAIDPRLPVIRDGEQVTATAEVVDRRVVDFGGSDTVDVQLIARDLPEGTNNLTIRLDKSDPLSIDNSRFLSIPAYAQRPSLVVATDPGIAFILQAIIDPSRGGASGGSVSLAEQTQYVQLADVGLDKFALVCLYDPPALSPRAVQKLEEHVRGGGGLMLILGPQLESVAGLATNPLRKLLPGVLTGPALRNETERKAFLEPVAISHPVFGELGESPNDILWNLFPIYRNWTFESLDDGVQLLMEVSDGQGPALTSHSLGRGQILTLTTPLPEPEVRGRPLWNLLWANDDPVPAFGLLLGAFRTLSGTSQTGFDYQVGQAVQLENDPSHWPAQYTLYAPGRDVEQRVRADQGRLELGSFDQMGIYALRGQRTEPIVRGFSINVPAEDTQLERLSPQQLDELLGAGNYRLARNRDEVESSVGQARFGRELYPLLMALVATLFLAEQAMSNRFYKLKFTRARSV
ncbi:BatA domain-containing protein [Aureliella helgolandensis]|uniref:Aerotolerance regulator N-terminal domain-containing protein n=1 Tax=Aureliella helgolandensis TaxID=2527968 RepID=A0A518FZR1_9BACT|nr:BatA domain-containing protein [Aureliella helgolandensis]QDV21842.1 hypothetical protein Q31a_01210 [Aureliella helgolandensis]